jgi:hypothetical protein
VAATSTNGSWLVPTATPARHRRLRPKRDNVDLSANVYDRFAMYSSANIAILLIAKGQKNRTTYYSKNKG